MRALVHEPYEHAIDANVGELLARREPHVLERSLHLLRLVGIVDLSRGPARGIDRAACPRGCAPGHHRSNGRGIERHLAVEFGIRSLGRRCHTSTARSNFAPFGANGRPLM
jgi:hypothetical protein